MVAKLKLKGFTIGTNIGSHVAPTRSFLGWGKNPFRSRMSRGGLRGASIARWQIMKWVGGNAMCIPKFARTNIKVRTFEFLEAFGAQK